MAYNSRRGTRQRRGNPPITRNFVSGGQLLGGPATNQLRPPHGLPSLFEVNSNQFRPTTIQRMDTAPRQQQQFQDSVPQELQNHQQSSSSQIEKKPPPFKEEIPPLLERTEQMAVEEVVKTRTFTVKAGKISKRERQRRRNDHLSKILQPKNAVMILNELIKSISYNLTELPQPNQYQFMASVQVGEENHVGYGHSKMEAKSSAAEAALKSIVKNRNITQLSSSSNKDSDGDEKMETNESTLPWQHIASFALYKLLSDWGETPFQSNTSTINNNNNMSSTSSIDGGVVDQNDSLNDETMTTTGIPAQNRPAKRMPDNACHINPLMLLNQMLPHAQFEELGRSGDPPNIMFTFKCTVNGESFIGSGPNKKSAKKVVAFQVCHKILSVQYPPEIYTPTV